MGIIRFWDYYNNRISLFLILIMAHFGEAYMCFVPMEIAKRAGLTEEVMNINWLYLVFTKVFMFFVLCFALRVHKVSIPRSMTERYNVEHEEAR